MNLVDQVDSVIARKPSVAVVGDFLLDGWWTGSAERVAREAPAPVVEVAERREVPGGAANTAVNLASLGALARAVGTVGLDTAAEALCGQLSDAGVDISGIERVAGASTTTKVRVTVGEHVLLRLDDGQHGPWSAEARDAFVSRVARTTSGSDALLVCDYGSELLDDEVVAQFPDLPRPPLVVVDAHRPQRWRGLRPDIVTPNAAEAEAILGRSLGTGDERADLAIAATAELLDTTGANAVVVTLDRSGTVLLRRGEAPVRTSARPAPERQSSGAGDVFAAALTTACASGVPLRSAVHIAQGAADVAVQRAGTCVCTIAELRESFAAQAPEREAS